MSGFGGFTTGNGRDFLEAALHTYDAVIGYDHRTLTIDPRENAKDLMTRLSVHVTGQPMILDIITHSRGGLTTRSLLEYELPQSNWNGSVDKVVFVASTNGGTRLADPARWIDLIDLTTNRSRGRHRPSVGRPALLLILQPWQPRCPTKWTIRRTNRNFRQRSTLEAPTEAMQVGFGKLW